MKEALGDSVWCLLICLDAGQHFSNAVVFAALLQVKLYLHGKPMLGIETECFFQAECEGDGKAPQAMDVIIQVRIRDAHAPGGIPLGNAHFFELFQEQSTGQRCLVLPDQFAGTAHSPEGSTTHN